MEFFSAYKGTLALDTVDLPLLLQNCQCVSDGDTADGEPFAKLTF